MSRTGPWWAMVAVALWMVACQQEDDTDEFVPEPGDANGEALALAVEGKVFAATPEAEAVVSGGGNRPTPSPSPTPVPSPTPAVPDQVTLAIFTNCRNGEACLSYGVYEPDTGRKEFVSATCAMNTSMDGFEGTCWTFTEFEWNKFCDASIDVTETNTVVKIKLVGQVPITFHEADYVVNGDSDCVDLGTSPSPPPFVEE